MFLLQSGELGLLRGDLGRERFLEGGDGTSGDGGGSGMLAEEMTGGVDE